MEIIDVAIIPGLPLRSIEKTTSGKLVYTIPLLFHIGEIAVIPPAQTVVSVTQYPERDAVDHFRNSVRFVINT